MSSELDRIIPPEIKDDAFYQALCALARDAEIETVLEIGASSGTGSTEALARGIAENPRRPTLFSVEVSRARFAGLSARYAGNAQVRPCNVSSVAVSDFPTEAAVREFYHRRRTGLNAYPVERVLGWLRQDVAYIVDNAVPQNGIAAIKSEHRIADFGLVLIDGSEFTGTAELAQVYGCRIVALDDINSFKNFDNHHRMLRDHGYGIYAADPGLRNGYSIFVRRG